MWLEYVIKCSLFTRKWHMMGQSLMPWNSPYGIHLCLKWRKLTLELQINLQNPKLERLNEVDKSNLKDKCGKYLHPVNWDRLVTPKVSPEIWERLDCHARGKDLKLSNLLSHWLKSVILPPERQVCYWRPTLKIPDLIQKPWSEWILTPWPCKGMLVLKLCSADMM